MSYKDDLERADALFIQERLQEALDAYDAIYKQDSSLAIVQLRRGITKLKIGKYSSAISDLVEARIKDKSLEASALEFEARALFYSEDFKMAEEKFQNAIDSNEDFKGRLQPWIAKCQREITGTGIVMQPEYVEEKKAAAFGSTPTKASSSGPPKIAKVDYYQNAEDVNVTVIFRPKLTEAQKKMITISLGQEDVLVECQELGIEKKLRLFSSIQPSASSYRFGVHLELKLKKFMVGMQWLKLEKEEMAEGVVLRDNLMTDNKPPSYPSSSKRAQDWGKVDKEMEAQLKKEKPEGEAAMMGMFKDIFSQGDDETKRAMMKSYQTSGGTVLSTNWKEVKEKDYEGKDRPSAPDGQEWRDEKDKYK